MRKFIRAAVAAAITLGAGTGVLALPAAPAFAITCSNGPYSSSRGQGFVWRHFNGSTPDVSGVRSGIKWTGDGAICNYTSGIPATSVWIGISGYNPSTNYPVAGHLAQAGFWDGYTFSGTEQFCKFWSDETVGLQPQLYDCNVGSPDHPVGVSNGGSTDWSIHPVNGDADYQVFGCGNDAGDWTQCSPLSDDNTAVFSDPQSTVGEEQNLEDTTADTGNCDAHIFGAQSNQEKIGDPTGLLPLQGEAFSDENWTARSWGTGNAYTTTGQPSNPCSNPPIDYYLKESNPTRGLDFYDTRNSS